MEQAKALTASKTKIKEKKHKRTKAEKHELLFSWLCLVPSIIGILIFFVAPFAVVGRYSVIDNVISNNFVGLENFRKLFENNAFKIAAKNTGIFTAVAIPLAIVLSLLLAMLLDKKIPLKSQLRTCFLCPLMVPVASVVLVWQVIFSYHGALNDTLEKYGIAGIDWLNSKWAIGVVTVMFLWKTLGYNMILFMSALNNMPMDLIEVADLEGASRMYKFFKIRLRYLSPTIVFVLLFSLINSFKIFREVFLITGGYPSTELYMLQHFMNNTFESLDYQKLSAAAVVFALVMIVIIGIVFALENKFGSDVEE